MPRTPVNFRSERTGLQLWGRDTPSVSVREIQKKYCVAHFSALLPGNKEIGWDWKPRLALWFLNRNPVRRQGPRSRVKILLPEDRVAMWCKVFSLVLIRQDRFMEMGSNLCCTYYWKRQALCLGPMLPLKGRQYYCYYGRPPFFPLLKEDSFVSMPWTFVHRGCLMCSMSCFV